MRIIDDAKQIKRLIRQIGDIDLYRRIAELEAEIVEITAVCRDQEVELRRTRQKLIALACESAQRGVGADCGMLDAARALERDWIE